MPEPQRINASGRRLTGRARAAYDEGLASGPQRALDDTPEDVLEQVRVLRRKVRRDQFLRSVPSRYVDASYDQLDVDDQAADVIAGWLDSPAPTLFLAGEPGRGKTHAAYAVLHAALERDLWVAGCTVPDLLGYLRPGVVSGVPRIVAQCDIALFDDLAAERATDWAVEQFRMIVDARTREGKRQIVTTNLPYADLERHVGRPAMSRLTGGALTVAFAGRDRRRGW